MAMMVLWNPISFRRWQAISSGWSEEVVPTDEFCRYTDFNIRGFDFCQPMRWQEAFLWEGGAEYISGDYRHCVIPSSTKTAGRGDMLWLIRQESNQMILPLRGLTPPWANYFLRWHVSNPFRPEAFEASLPCNLGTVGRAQKRHEILCANDQIMSSSS
jgi:hypothetical protein